MRTPILRWKAWGGGGGANVFRGASRLSESEHGPLVQTSYCCGHHYFKLANKIMVMVNKIA